MGRYAELRACPVRYRGLRGRDLVVRRYDDQPEAASFLRASEGCFSTIPYSDMLFLATSRYLLDRDVRTLHCLLPSGYVPVDVARIQ